MSKCVDCGDESNGFPQCRRCYLTDRYEDDRPE
jgi:hypothetical protein